jgi:hypothetical protein
MKLLAVCVFACGVLCAQTPPRDLLPLHQPILDAHNCYPYEGKWTDRIDRALSTGYPVGIEQDLAWAVDKTTGKGHPVVSHSRQTTGDEPSLRDHFFEHVRPIVEKALREGNRKNWPLIVVHFDIKDNRPELHRALWDLLGEYESWLTTGIKTADPSQISPLTVGPLLALTEDNDAQEEVFFKALPEGAKMRLFGSAHTAAVPAQSREERFRLAVSTPPEKILVEKPTNYRRWWNSSWYVVEEGGQSKAGNWTPADDQRLKSLVDHAHALGYWIRFYTIDGFNMQENRGWDQGYNFGSRQAAALRWKAAVAAGVNLIATDQFEDLAAILATSKNKINTSHNQ